MRRWLVIAAAIVVVASSCSGTRAAESPTASHSAKPSASNLVSLSGENSFQSDPITIPAGKYHVAWTVHDPEGSLYLLIGLIHGTDIQPQNERTWLINSEVPATSTGAAEFDSAAGEFIIVVEIMPNTYMPTTWTLTVAPLSTPG
jgi:hypothetical protein